MVGEKIKKLRKRKKITQDDLASFLGVSRQAISMWESNKRELKATTLKKMAKVFGVSLDEILNLEGTIIKQRRGAMVTRGRPKKATFELQAPDAKEVLLTGSFTNWDKKPVKMKKNRKGQWNAGVTLKPGKYEYKFVVDGQWWNDPSNQNTITNEFGAVNSLVEVGAK